MKSLLAITAMALLATPALADGFAVAPSAQHQPIKAEVTNPDPAHFTINLKKLANMNVNQEARTFAMYTGGALPAQCGDFTKSDIDYKKPDKYHRVFNLSAQPEIIDALNEYGCVIIPNKPKHPPASS